MEEDRRESYRTDKRALRIAISNAKAQSWKELLEELDRNPWGLAYKIVRNKLRRWAPPSTEVLEASGYSGEKLVSIGR